MLNVHDMREMKNAHNQHNSNDGRQNDLANLLVRCRTERNLRLDDVAAATGLTLMTISLVERGKTQPRRTTRAKIEDFLRKHGYFPKQVAA
jgi:DNA-binding XRE family transcriptional regulator